MFSSLEKVLEVYSLAEDFFVGMFCLSECLVPLYVVIFFVSFRGLVV
jgi:hypothetical protein